MPLARVPWDPPGCRNSISSLSIPSPLWDTDIQAAYHRSLVYSGLAGVGYHTVYALASLEAATEYASALGTGARGPAGELQTWFGRLVSGKIGDPAALEAAIAEPGILGGLTRLRTYETGRARLPGGDPAIIRAARRLTTQLDSRISHRIELGDIAFSDLMDLKLTEALFGSALAAAPTQRPGLAVWFARLNGRSGLKRGLEVDRAHPLTAAGKAEMLDSADQLEPEDPDELEPEFKRLVAQEPDAWKVRDRYVRYLEKRARYRDALEVVRPWLASHDPSAGLDYVYAATAVGRMHYHLKEYQKGWDAVEPVVGSMQAGAMERGALLLDRLERPEEALSLVKRAMDRYPDLARVRVTQARILWRNGRHAEAAGALKAGTTGLRWEEWKREIAPQFLESFEGRPKEEALRAFTALVDAGLDPLGLRYLSGAFGRAGRFEEAFEMHSRLKPDGLVRLELMAGAYGYLKKAKDEATALEWLRGSLPAKMREPLALFAFSSGNHELQWTLVEPKRDPDFTWLMRAASFARSPDPAHREELLAHYQQPGEHYHTLGRYLMGLVPEAEAIALMTDAKKHCEVPFYLGLAAERDGRYGDASDWYRIVVETGLSNNGEYHWALDTLYRWLGVGRTLELLAKLERPNAPAPTPAR